MPEKSQNGKEPDREACLIVLAVAPFEAILRPYALRRMRPIDALRRTCRPWRPDRQGARKLLSGLALPFSIPVRHVTKALRVGHCNQDLRTSCQTIGTSSFLPVRGLSAESGLGTFRDAGGIWTKYDLNDVATPQGFARDPGMVLEFYNARRENALGAKPNAAHEALARLEAAHPGNVTVVTQNIDALHEAAGTRNLIHMHGDLARSLCNFCGQRCPWDEPLRVNDTCPACHRAGGMRPNVVWFGEMPHAMDEICRQLSIADLFISIGTSGTVYPAAGFVAEAQSAGARTVELNLEPSEGVSLFDEVRHGPATKTVPSFVDKLLNGG